jgi:hypothetical protein
MAFALVYTAEHYVIDILLGWAYTLVAVWVVNRVATGRGVESGHGEGCAHRGGDGSPFGKDHDRLGILVNVLRPKLTISFFAFRPRGRSQPRHRRQLPTAAGSARLPRPQSSS